MIEAAMTVLFSTFNGATVLKRVLDGYVRQQLGHASWKVVIVDNGSTDDTKQVLERYGSALPLIVLSQPNPGKNRALNTAVEQIRTDLLILTDDDAVPHPGFLQAWQPVLGAHPAYAVFGGRINPTFEEAPPSWLKASTLPFDVLFAARDLPTGEIAPQEIFGPNMALKGSMINAGVRFNEAIGPNGADKNYPMGSETELCERLARGGERCFFFAPPQVDHIVRPAQMTLPYIVGRARRSGRGEARRRLLAGDLTPEFASSGLRRLRREMGQIVRSAAGRLPPSRLSLRLLWDRSWSQGFYEELAREAAAQRV